MKEEESAPQGEEIREFDLYPLVENWTKQRFGCFKTAVNKGVKYSRIDVLGVRDIGGDLSGEIETVAIEVKRGRTPFAVASGQTLGYRVYTNRVYLADLRKGSFSPDEVAIASNLGIGLIKIEPESCTEELSSPLYQPITRLNLALLENVGLGQCRFCGLYFETGDSKRNRFSNLIREDLVQAVEESKGLMFWNEEVSRRKNQFHVKRTEEDPFYERRFICAECVAIFFSHLKDVRGFMETFVNWLEKNADE